MKINALYKISSQPEIYTSAGSKNWTKLRGTKEEPVYLLAHSMWYFGLSSVWYYFKVRRQIKKQHVKFVLLTNSPRENLLARLAGFDAHFINHNIHVNENVFRPIKEKYSQKIYDAVYTAAAEPYKRLSLASAIKKLYVVTYFYNKGGKTEREPDLHKYEPTLSHCEYNKVKISHEAINDLLNQSHTGLALSRKEGAMFASMEYLMAGIPVVNTKNKGGRDTYFDPEYVITASDTPSAVRQAVDELASRKIDPLLIRKKTMDKVEKDRKLFFDLVSKIWQKAAAPNRPSYNTFHTEVWGGIEGLSKKRVEV